MTLLLKTSLWFLFYLTTFFASAQEFQHPSPGKSMVYFFRSNGSGALINFKYFDGEKYLGKFNGMGYFAYECEPGQHIFWAAAENRSFLDAVLLPDKVYLIEARPTMGAFKAAVRLYPVPSSEEKFLKKMEKFMVKRGPINLNERDTEGEEERLDYFIQNAMEKYNRDKEKGKSILQMLPEYHQN